MNKVIYEGIKVITCKQVEFNRLEQKLTGTISHENKKPKALKCKIKQTEEELDPYKNICEDQKKELIAIKDKNIKDDRMNEQREIFEGMMRAHEENEHNYCNMM